MTPCGGEPGVGEVDGVRREGTDLARTASMPASSISASMSCMASIPTIAGVPEMKRRMPPARLVAGAHQERVGCAHPALDRLRVQPSSEVPLGDVGERGRAGAAVEVLVGAPDREVDAPARRARPAPTPAEWHRSHSTSAPASWATAVIAAASARWADR